MTTQQLTDEQKTSAKDMYNDAVKLLELLNVIIPKLENPTIKIQHDLIDAVSNKCWELGGGLAVADFLDDKDDEDMAAMVDFFGC